ncbi:MAG: glycosyltransferase [Calditrichia bacterium]
MGKSQHLRQNSPAGAQPDGCATHPADAKINLCLSSQQLGSAVSLRAYEIPASGGFLLTDWKDDLADLFAEDEIVSFRSVDEMNDKIDFYQRHPEKREPVIRKARERVINEHQVFHRIQKMLAIAAKIEW